jgi:hypothetical protein
VLGGTLTYKEKYIQDMWQSFHRNDSFHHPLGSEATLADFKQMDQPPFFKENPI